MIENDIDKTLISRKGWPEGCTWEEWGRLIAMLLQIPPRPEGATYEELKASAMAQEELAREVTGCAKEYVRFSPAFMEQVRIRLWGKTPVVRHCAPELYAMLRQLAD